MVLTICGWIRDLTPVITEFMKIKIDKRVTPSTKQFLWKQTADHYCQSLCTTVGEPRSIFSYEVNAYLLSNAWIDGSLQNFVPIGLRGIYSIFSTNQLDRDIQSQDVCNTQ